MGPFFVDVGPRLADSNSVIHAGTFSSVMSIQALLDEGFAGAFDTVVCGIVHDGFDCFRGSHVVMARYDSRFVCCLRRVLFYLR